MLLDGTAAAADFLLVNDNADVKITNSLTVNTNANVATTTAGSIYLGSGTSTSASTISATVAGKTLTLQTTGTVNGNIAFGSVTNASGGQYVAALTVNAGTGTVTLNGGSILTNGTTAAGQRGDHGQCGADGLGDDRYQPDRRGGFGHGGVERDGLGERGG